METLTNYFIGISVLIFGFLTIILSKRGWFNTVIKMICFFMFAIGIIVTLHRLGFILTPVKYLR
jgi:hypothetical protein